MTNNKTKKPPAQLTLSAIADIEAAAAVEERHLAVDRIIRAGADYMSEPSTANAAAYAAAVQAWRELWCGR